MASDRVIYRPMSRTDRYRCLGILLLTTFSLAMPSNEPHWIRIDSSHFAVLTDADDKRGHDVSGRFEQMRAVFGQLLLRSRLNWSEPIDVIAVRNNEEF